MLHNFSLMRGCIVLQKTLVLQQICSYRDIVSILFYDCQHLKTLVSIHSIYEDPTALSLSKEVIKIPFLVNNTTNAMIHAFITTLIHSFCGQEPRAV